MGNQNSNSSNQKLGTGLTSSFSRHTHQFIRTSDQHYRTMVTMARCLSIMAFGDRNQIPPWLLQSAGIQIFPEGDKHARIRLMMSKFFLWATNNVYQPTNMLVSWDGMELAFAFNIYEDHTQHSLCQSSLSLLPHTATTTIPPTILALKHGFGKP